MAYRFFQGSTFPSETLTFYAVWEQAASLAYLMRSHGLLNQRALVACKSQKNFVIAFYACLLAGVIAVPTAPPRRKSLLSRLELLIRDAQVQVIITDCDEVQLTDFVLESQTLQHFDMRSWMQNLNQVELAAHWTMPPLTGESIAFLQYTSGSTGDPKGVVITHANLIHNCIALQQAMAYDSTSSVFTSLPLFHDMGLIGGVLEPMYAGCTANCMSPTEFIQYPERWLQVVSAFQITISGGPNFFYELAARAIKPEQMQGCDLSAWRVAFCGAEPIRATTISLFTQQFAPFGFQPETFYPCYGMAESTVFITGNKIGTLPTVCNQHGSEVVGCGIPRHDTRIEIVDPETFIGTPNGCVGEIWVNGSSIAQGYWGRPELTERTFHAYNAGDDSSRFLRTGDLGYLKNNELYVTGRLKDLIIVYGKKYAPQDFEDDAERSHVALRQAGGAAFCVAENYVERLVVVFELKREWLRRQHEHQSIRNAIRTSINYLHGVTVDDVVLIRPGALPRTSSGKVQRTRCRTDYLSGAFDHAIST